MFGLVTLVYVIFSSHPGQEASSCAQTLDRYTKVRSNLISCIESYEQCVRSEDPDNNCLTEYRELQPAQSELQAAVAAMRKACRNSHSK